MTHGVSIEKNKLVTWELDFKRAIREGKEKINILGCMYYVLSVFHMMVNQQMLLCVQHHCWAEDRGEKNELWTLPMWSSQLPADIK